MGEGKAKQMKVLALMTSSQVANRIGVAPDTVRDATRKGYLRPSVVANGMSLFSDRDVKAWERRRAKRKAARAA